MSGATDAATNSPTIAADVSSPCARDAGRKARGVVARVAGRLGIGPRSGGTAAGPPAGTPRVLSCLPGSCRDRPHPLGIRCGGTCAYGGACTLRNLHDGVPHLCGRDGCPCSEDSEQQDLGSDIDADLAKFLAIHLKPFEATAAAMVPQKGPTEYAIEAVMHYLKLWGIQECILKSDQEPSIEALLAAVKAWRDDRTSFGASPKGDHPSNPAEGEIKRLEGPTRSLITVVEN